MKNNREIAIAAEGLNLKDVEGVLARSVFGGRSRIISVRLDKPCTDFLEHFSPAKVLGMINEIDRLKEEREEWVEREAACCPEDRPFDEVIEYQNKEIDRLTKQWEDVPEPYENYDDFGQSMLEDNDRLTYRAVERGMDRDEVKAKLEKMTAKVEVLEDKLKSEDDEIEGLMSILDRMAGELLEHEQGTRVKELTERAEKAERYLKDMHDVCCHMARTLSPMWRDECNKKPMEETSTPRDVIKMYCPGFDEINEFVDVANDE